MRYTATGKGNSSWKIFDKKRGCSIATSISPNAKYNEEVFHQIASALNRSDKT